MRHTTIAPIITCALGCLLVVPVAAQALGITIPPPLLLLTDEVMR